MKSMGDFILGIIVGVLVTLGVLGSLLMVQTRDATRQARQAEAARMEAEMQRQRAEEAVQEAPQQRRRAEEDPLKAEKLKMPRVDDRPRPDSPQRHKEHKENERKGQ
jgi:hypothetical protein